MNLNCIASGIFFTDITDHLPCFLTVKCGTHTDKEIRPKTRLFGEKYCKKSIELMEGQNWKSIHETDTDWYFNFISTIRDMFGRCFLLVNVSGRRLKDKPLVTKCIKNSIKKSHRLYRRPIGNSNQKNTMKYKMYQIILGKCLKLAEAYYHFQIFDDTKQSTYNLWKCFGHVINPTKTKKQLSSYEIFHQYKYITDTHDMAKLWIHTSAKLVRNFKKYAKVGLCIQIESTVRFIWHLRQQMKF